MRDFDDFRTSSSILCRAADVPDYTWFWWKLRPHPRLGTVEIRALDTRRRSRTSERWSP
jgi:carboxylate-amine ligase